MFLYPSNDRCLPTVTKETCFMGKPSHVASYWRRDIASRPISDNPPVVCCCGRLSATVKLVTAVLAVRSSFELFKLVLVGHSMGRSGSFLDLGNSVKESLGCSKGMWCRGLLIVHASVRVLQPRIKGLSPTSMPPCLMTSSGPVITLRKR